MGRLSEISTVRDDGAPAALAAGDLILVIGNGQLLTHRVTSAEVIIGREPGCTLTIEHPSLSRRHARLRIDAAVTIEDLGSTNGTRVDGQLLRGGPPVTVHDHGAFQIGPFAFVLVPRRHVSQASVSGRHQLQVVDPTVAGAPRSVREFARTDANILIRGETGVGKEILAATVHALSGRTGPLVQINCAALSESLLENELFGHERGAFTGAHARSTGLIEAAAGGTLFLDEIGEMPLATQAKLLRVIERREVLRLGASRPVTVDVHFVAATHRDLVAEVARQAFRQDLYFRLDGVTLVIPPLRERPGMIAPLALDFVAELRRDAREALTAEVISALEAYPWPGNVRELKAVLGRAVVLARGGPLSPRHLMLDHAAPPAGPPVPVRAPAPGPELASAPEPADDADRAADRARIVQALEACAGNQTRAAKLLGISRTTMITKLRIYQIPRPTAR
ncbi:MAG: sigma 54-interacting transcriptional regulator [Kofleriaceae bacterium]